MDGLVQIQVVVQRNAGGGWSSRSGYAGPGLVRRTLGSTIACALLHQMDEDRRASVEKKRPLQLIFVRRPTMRVASLLVAFHQSNVGRRNPAASLRDATELLPPAPQPDQPKRLSTAGYCVERLALPGLFQSETAMK